MLAGNTIELPDLRPADLFSRNIRTGCHSRPAPSCLGLDNGVAEGIQSMISFDQSSAFHLRYPGFRSFKTAESIHYRHRYCRLALIQDTLDERVLELANVDLAVFGGEDWLDCIYRRRTRRGWETISIGKTTKKDAGVMECLWLTREQLACLPGADAARLIWSKRNHPVSLSTRMAALELTSGARTTTLGALLPRICGAGGQTNEVLALIADGTLQIDASVPMTSATIIRQRGDVR